VAANVLSRKALVKANVMMHTCKLYEKFREFKSWCHRS